MRHLIGIDGGGTRTTLAVADEGGRELLRREGPAGLVDPRDPRAAAEMLVRLARGALADAGAAGPAAVMVAGLAGAGSASERAIVESVLASGGVAQRVVVCSDGEVALHGALSGGAGVLLVAGTGSIAYGRAEDGRIERCGGWGMIVGDEGSGYGLARQGLVHALRAHDGRGPATRLLPVLLAEIGADDPGAVPPWVATAGKSRVAALAVAVLRLAAGGDAVARALVDAEAAGLVDHATALARRLGPWSAPVPVVLHGGLCRSPHFRERVEHLLRRAPERLDPRPAAADAVSGAVAMARQGLAWG